MRLRSWLLLTYLLVMTLPLAMAYVLFAWINSINSEQKVQEFFNAYLETRQIKETLENPALYVSDKHVEQVDDLVTDKMSVTLYDSEGYILYSPLLEPLIIQINKKELYKGLYSLDQGYRTFTYKEPVYEKDILIGFFEVTISRNEWTTKVSNRTLFVGIIFSIFFLLIYLTVIWFVHRKLNVRMTRLMDDMSAFAQGKVIEERVTNKDEIGKLTQHFYSMRKQINDARDTIAKEQETKAYMIATISHDLKTPLTSIKAYAEMLDTEQGLTKEERHLYEKIIIEKADFMKQMLDDLLMYTLLQSPSYNLDFVLVDGEEFFEMLISDYELLCKEKGIYLKTMSCVNGQYELSPQQLIRVTDNLMSNAIQHTEARNHIWLSAYSDKGAELDWLFPFVNKEIHFDIEENVYLIVQNEGKGIEESKLAYIFDPLYQAD